MEYGSMFRILPQTQNLDLYLDVGLAKRAEGRGPSALGGRKPTAEPTGESLSTLYESKYGIWIHIQDIESRIWNMEYGSIFTIIQDTDTDPEFGSPS